jgi:hypothetical protein
MKTRASIVSLVVTTSVICAAFTPSFHVRQSPTKQSLLSLREGKDGPSFSLGNLFGGSSADSGGAAATKTNKNSEPHPSVRSHISPLNRLGPDAKKLEIKGEPLPVHPDVRSGTLANGLPYIILPNKNPPDRFEAHLQVFSGSGEWMVH